MENFGGHYHVVPGVIVDLFVGPFWPWWPGEVRQESVITGKFVTLWTNGVAHICVHVYWLGCVNKLRYNVAPC